MYDITMCYLCSEQCFSICVLLTKAYRKTAIRVPGLDGRMAEP